MSAKNEHVLCGCSAIQMAFLQLFKGVIMKIRLSTIFCVAIVFCAFFHSLAYAVIDSQFPLRSGIHFGDTVEEVKEKEQGLKLKEEKNSTLKYRGLIAGYDGDATFYFDKDEKLTDLTDHYLFFDADEVAKIYVDIKNLCSEEHGAPLTEEKKPFKIMGKTLELAVLTVTLSREAEMKSDIVTYDEWVVFTDEGMIKIEEVLYYIGQAYYVDIGFHYYPIS